MTTVKLPLGKRKSLGRAAQLAIGAAIANQLEPKASLRDVAKKLGISHVMVRKEECMALYKLQARFKEIAMQAELARV